MSPSATVDALAIDTGQKSDFKSEPAAVTVRGSEPFAERRYV